MQVSLLEHVSVVIIFESVTLACKVHFYGKYMCALLDFKIYVILDIIYCCVVHVCDLKL